MFGICPLDVQICSFNTVTALYLELCKYRIFNQALTNFAIIGFFFLKRLFLPLNIICTLCTNHSNCTKKLIIRSINVQYLSQECSVFVPKYWNFCPEFKQQHDIQQNRQRIIYNYSFTNLEIIGFFFLKRQFSATKYYMY